MSGIIKIFLPIILIAGLIYGLSVAFIGTGLNFNILTEIFVYIKQSMLAFDWIVPYSVQLSLMTTFLIVESGIMLFKVVNYIIGFFTATNSVD